MKLIFANPKYWPALLQDTIGQEDKAKATLGLDTLAKKQDFWYTTAVLCAAVGVLAAPFTYGISLALLFVTWRKYDLIKTKKEAPNVVRSETVPPLLPGPGTEAMATGGTRPELGGTPVSAGVNAPFGLLGQESLPGAEPKLDNGGSKMTDVGLASGPTTGKKTWQEKLTWLKQSVAIQFRTRRWLAPAMAAALVAGSVGAVLHYTKKSQPTIVAPKQLCECPLKTEPPVQGKAAKKTEKK